ncbi:hypothetical protein AVEN_110575-1 [Araneus ventricosus]|uniref:Uncharacterized protein n=1 Tax=Araneus ventricosus TaxID=182803 RepID=A0A4Y2JM24_ARAVE|nr:hypothetical protein AVEN_76288-1 [Araneus ventricosus]GBM91096.1 hypothetical protein AVEN_110575-1 [Araneus ventricosus]
MVHVKSDVVGQMSSRWCDAEVWRGNVCASSGVVLIISPRFKITRSVPKYPSCCSRKRDVNVTKLKPFPASHKILTRQGNRSAGTYSNSHSAIITP